MYLNPNRHTGGWAITLSILVVYLAMSVSPALKHEAYQASKALKAQLEPNR
jgi:hypothetical protein